MARASRPFATSVPPPPLRPVTAPGADPAMPRPLQPAQLWSRLQATLPPSVPAALVLRPTPVAHLLARLLPSHVHLLAPPSESHLLRDLPNPVHHIPAPPDPASSDLRAHAAWGIRNDVRHLILPDTRLDRALHALTSIDAGVPSAFVGGPSTGVEMLPPGTLHFHTPLDTIDEATIDASLHSLLPSLDFVPQSRLAEHALGDTPVPAVLRHARHKASAVERLVSDSTRLIERCVLEASHWGYVVARRTTLADVYHSGRARLTAVHALSRMILHVSGASEQHALGDEQVARLAHDLLARSPAGTGLVPLPKGRTAGGMVVRPATGRFAKRLLQRERRGSSNVPDDLMILTREPDHESAGLHATRLRGNFACAPVAKGGVYWDNRFVVSAGRVDELSDDRAPLVTKDVLLAALSKPQDMKQRLTDAELYVRQIRRVDWERITAATNRVRDFQVPFQCVRALPAVFQKQKGSPHVGELIASPHLGLSSRADLYFTAVRMPRFRSLPESVCPGFVEGCFREGEEAQTG